MKRSGQFKDVSDAPEVSESDRDGSHSARGKSSDAGQDNSKKLSAAMPPPMKTASAANPKRKPAMKQTYVAAHITRPVREKALQARKKALPAQESDKPASEPVTLSLDDSNGESDGDEEEDRSPPPSQHGRRRRKVDKTEREIIEEE